MEVFTDDGSPKAHGSSPGDDTRFADQNSPPSKDKTAAPQQEQDKQPAAVEGPVCPMPLQQRVYCDPQPQHWLEQAFAAVTLSIYLSWIHILLMLIVGSLFSTTLMYITIGRCLCLCAVLGRAACEGVPCQRIANGGWVQTVQLQPTQCMCAHHLLFCWLTHTHRHLQHPAAADRALPVSCLPTQPRVGLLEALPQVSVCAGGC